VDFIGNPPSSLSVVVPVFCSASSLPEVVRRLTATLSTMTDRWEVIFVDDASPDDAFQILRELRARDPRLKIIQLARNRGQHYATLCGLHYSSGDYAFTLDDDLQTPSEELPRFLAKLQEGYDVVIGKIEGTKQHPWARNLGSVIHQRLAECILGKPKHLALSSYRGFSRRALEMLKTYRGAHPQVAALIFKGVHVSSIANVEFRHEPRAYGSSTYSLGRLVALDSTLLIHHSDIPLRITVAWGMIVSVVSIAFAMVLLVRTVFVGSTLVGWASLAILISFFCGNILFALGILGEYLARLIEESAPPQQFGIHRMEF
jgi:polyisoprenyl-phosphate glycosyltransferase